MVSDQQLTVECFFLPAKRVLNFDPDTSALDSSSAHTVTTSSAVRDDELAELLVISDDDDDVLLTVAAETEQLVAETGLSNQQVCSPGENVTSCLIVSDTGESNLQVCSPGENSDSSSQHVAEAEDKHSSIGNSSQNNGLVENLLEPEVVSDKLHCDNDMTKVGCSSEELKDSAENTEIL